MSEVVGVSLKADPTALDRSRPTAVIRIYSLNPTFGKQVCYKFAMEPRNGVLPDLSIRYHCESAQETAETPCWSGITRIGVFALGCSRRC